MKNFKHCIQWIRYNSAMFTPHKIAVMYHPQVNNAVQEAAAFADYILQAHGLDVPCASLYDDDLRKRVRAKEFDVLIAMGGDGTLLRAGHLCAPHNVPMLGINLGRFGFLTEVSVGDWKPIIPRLMRGDFWLENRMMLQCDHLRGKEHLGNWDVLNEVWVGRGESVRPVHLITYVDGRYLTTYVADGLIASTPTGSTAYALAAGGPILPPELRNILLVAVAPHLSIDRAIVLAEGSAVTITVQTDHQAVLSVDGQAPVHLANDDMVTAHASDYTCNFIRFQDPGYFYRNLTPHMSQNPITGNNR
jgi:NAD+ kinase